MRLCRVTTSDGLRLEGLLQFPLKGFAPSTEAVLLIHGTGSNFHSAGVLERFSEQANEAGMAALRINTRGHDLASRIPAAKGSVRGGAAFEAIEDAPRDVAAWLTFLVDEGFRRVALVGHSMGAVKAILAAASLELVGTPPYEAVAGVMGISPPRFCHANLMSAEAFRRDFSQATQLVAAGKGDSLIEVTQPLPLLITASGFLRKYGPQDTFDYTRALAKVQRPVLILVGTESVQNSKAFAGSPEHVASLGLAHVAVETVEGANISYSGCQDEPFRRFLEWLPA